MNTLPLSPLTRATTLFIYFKQKKGKNKSYTQCQPLVFAKKTPIRRHNKKVHTHWYTLMPLLSLWRLLDKDKTIKQHTHAHTYSQSRRVFIQSCGSIGLCQGSVGFCSLLLSFACLPVCCAESLMSPLCTRWSLLASYPLNISVFVGRL